MIYKFKINIMGMTWTVILFAAFEPEDSGAAAMTLPNKREFHFKLDDIRLGAIRHEVRHAFTNELCLTSADLSCEQMEEIQCSLDENRHKQMDELSLKIYKKLKKGH